MNLHASFSQIWEAIVNKSMQLFELGKYGFDRTKYYGEKTFNFTKSNKLYTLLTLVTIFFIYNYSKLSVFPNKFFKKFGDAEYHYNKYPILFNGIFAFFTFTFLLLFFYQTYNLLVEGNQDDIGPQFSDSVKYSLLIFCTFVLFTTLFYALLNYKYFAVLMILLINFFIFAFLFKYVLKEAFEKLAESVPIIKHIFMLPFVIYDGILGDIQATSKLVFYILAIEFVILGLYFLVPFLRRTYSNRLGKQLLNKPLYLSNQHIIGSYEELNPPEKQNRKTKFVRFKNEKFTKFKSKRDQFLCKNFNVSCELENELNEHIEKHTRSNFNYDYSLSMWFFIHERPPNTNKSYSKYTEIFNFGNKPKILYNAKEQKIKVIMQHHYDTMKTIYVGEFPLQKWNNVVITYDNGNLDVFINGDIVATQKNIVPHMSYDSVSVGSLQGIDGGVANVMFYPNVLPFTNIQKNYKELKENPVVG